MRRSICIAEPHVARAGVTSTWRFHYSTNTPLPKGAKLKFDIQSCGRDIDWDVPTSHLEEGADVIYATLEDGTLLEAEEVEVPESYIPQYEFTLPSPLKIGGKVTIVMGAPPKAKDLERLGNRCQLTIQRRRPFLLYIDSKGKGNYEEPETFGIDIKGGNLYAIRILTPSFVAKNKRFDITVRFEDEYGNLTNSAPEDTLIELTYEHLRENLNWKLFVPETGFVILPNLYFNETGVYRIQLKNLKTGANYFSSPIKCFSENDRNLFWGLFHGESERVDSTENIENCLRHFRDDRHLNFYTSSCFDSTEETSNDIWKLISQNIADFNEEDRFITFLGFQYQGEDKTEGIRLIVYIKDNRPLLRQKETKSSSLGKIYKTHTPKDFISIPSFTMGKGTVFDFKNFNSEYERVVEIYNAWGCSLKTAKEGNPRPITSLGRGGVEEDDAGSVEKALKAGHRFGFIAGGLDDRGIYSDFYDSEQVQYTPGFTGVISPKHNRESIMDALFKRNCYATTGAKIIVGFYIAGHPMGGELSTAKKPGLSVNRHISGYVAGEDTIRSIEIIRNGEVIHTLYPQVSYCDYTYDDMEPLDQFTLKREKGLSPFVYYYLQVTQEDGHLAWTSPIWIDCLASAETT
ncbi:MAG: DUF3604 domain-containing protein [Chlamydiia bacterium]|nr:DUF3604 domain-containing protein [Chlamydiia bacterium]